MSEQNTLAESRKIAIVTGGSRSIGRNTVESLAKRGVSSIFAYNNRNTDAEAGKFARGSGSKTSRSMGPTSTFTPCKSICFFAPPIRKCQGVAASRTRRFPMEDSR